MRFVFQKPVAFLTLTAYLVSQFYGQIPSAWAQPETSIKPSFTFDLPADLGSIDSIHSGTGPAIFHIQEAHGNIEGQKNIQKILKHLNTQYGVNTVLLEGDAFPLKPELVRFFPEDMPRTMKALDQLADKGVITGPELFLAETNSAHVFGIEEVGPYVQNGQAFHDVLKAKEASEKFLNELDLKLKKKISKEVNVDLREFLKDQEKNESNILPTHTWISLLQKKAQEIFSLNLHDPREQIDWPMMLRVNVLSEMEKKFDQREFEKQREKFLIRVKEELSGVKGVEKGKPVLTLLNPFNTLLTQPFSSPAPANLEPQIEALVASLPKDFDFKAYPQVNRFIGHKLLSAELKGDKLIKEIELLTEKIMNKLIKTEQEQKIVEELKDYKLLKKLLNLELTAEEYEKVKGSKGLKRIEGGLKGNAFEPLLTPLNPLYPVYESALEFYRLAKERDLIMIRNIEKRLGDGRREMGVSKNQLLTPDSQPPAVVVITGGFHSKPFQEYFTSKNYNYALISPKMSSTEGRDQYLKSALENFIRTEYSVPSTVSAVPASPAGGRSTHNAVRSISTRRVSDYAQGASELRQLGINPAFFENPIREVLRSEMRSQEPLFEIGLSGESYFKGEFTRDASLEEFLNWIHKKFPGSIIQSAEKGYDVRYEDPPLNPLIDLGKTTTFSKGSKVGIQFDERTVKYVALNVALRTSKETLRQAQSLLSQGRHVLLLYQEFNPFLQYLEGQNGERIDYVQDPFIGEQIVSEALQIRERIFGNASSENADGVLRQQAQTAFEKIQEEPNYSGIRSAILERSQEIDAFEYPVQKNLLTIAKAVKYQKISDIETMIEVLALLTRDSSARSELRKDFSRSEMRMDEQPLQALPIEKLLQQLVLVPRALKGRAREVADFLLNVDVASLEELFGNLKDNAPHLLSLATTLEEAAKIATQNTEEVLFIRSVIDFLDYIYRKSGAEIFNSARYTVQNQLNKKWDVYEYPNLPGHPTTHRIYVLKNGLSGQVEIIETKLMKGKFQKIRHISEWPTISQLSLHSLDPSQAITISTGMGRIRIKEDFGIFQVQIPEIWFEQIAANPNFSQWQESASNPSVIRLVKQDPSGRSEVRGLDELKALQAIQDNQLRPQRVIWDIFDPNVLNYGLRILKKRTFGREVIDPKLLAMWSEKFQKLGGEEIKNDQALKQALNAKEEVIKQRLDYLREYPRNLKKLQTLRATIQSQIDLYQDRKRIPQSLQTAKRILDLTWDMKGVDLTFNPVGMVNYAVTWIYPEPEDPAADNHPEIEVFNKEHSKSWQRWLGAKDHADVLQRLSEAEKAFRLLQLQSDILSFQNLRNLSYERSEVRKDFSLIEFGREFSTKLRSELRILADLPYEPAAIQEEIQKLESQAQKLSRNKLNNTKREVLEARLFLLRALRYDPVLQTIAFIFADPAMKDLTRHFDLVITPNPDQIEMTIPQSYEVIFRSNKKEELFGILLRKDSDRSQKSGANDPPKIRYFLAPFSGSSRRIESDFSSYVENEKALRERAEQFLEWQTNQLLWNQLRSELRKKQTFKPKQLGVKKPGEKSSTFWSSKPKTNKPATTGLGTYLGMEEQPRSEVRGREGNDFYSLSSLKDRPIIWDLTKQRSPFIQLEPHDFAPEYENQIPDGLFITFKNQDQTMGHLLVATPAVESLSGQGELDEFYIFSWDEGNLRNPSSPPNVLNYGSREGESNDEVVFESPQGVLLKAKLGEFHSRNKIKQLLIQGVPNAQNVDQVEFRVVPGEKFKSLTKWLGYRMSFNEEEIRELFPSRSEVRSAQARNIDDVAREIREEINIEVVRRHIPLDKPASERTPYTFKTNVPKARSLLLEYHQLLLAELNRQLVPFKTTAEKLRADHAVMIRQSLAEIERIKKDGALYSRMRQVKMGGSAGGEPVLDVLASEFQNSQEINISTAGKIPSDDDWKTLKALVIRGQALQAFLPKLEVLNRALAAYAPRSEVRALVKESREYQIMAKAFEKLAGDPNLFQPTAPPIFIKIRQIAQEKLKARFNEDRGDQAADDIKTKLIPALLAQHSGDKSWKQGLGQILLHQAEYFSNQVNGFGTSDFANTENSAALSKIEDQMEDIYHASMQAIDALPLLADPSVLEGLSKIAARNLKAHEKAFGLQKMLNEMEEIRKDENKKEETQQLSLKIDAYYEATRRWTDMYSKIIETVATIGLEALQSGQIERFDYANQFLTEIIVNSEITGEGFYWVRTQAIYWLKKYDTDITLQALDRVIDQNDPASHIPQDSIYIAQNLEAANSNTITMRLYAGEVRIHIHETRGFKAVQNGTMNLDFEKENFRFARIKGLIHALVSSEVAEKEKAAALRFIAESKDADFLLACNLALNTLEEIIDPGHREIFSAGTQFSTALQAEAKKAYLAIASTVGKELHKAENNSLAGEFDSNFNHYSRENAPIETFRNLAEKTHIVLGNLHRLHELPSFENGTEYMNISRKVVIQSGGGAAIAMDGVVNRTTTDPPLEVISGTDNGGASLLNRGFDAAELNINEGADGDIDRGMIEAAVIEGAPSAEVIKSLLNHRFALTDKTFSQELDAIYPKLIDAARKEGSAEVFEKAFQKVKRYAALVDAIGLKPKFNAVKGLVYQGIQLMTRGHGKEFMNPDGIYSGMRELQELTGAKALAVLDHPIGNEMIVTTRSGQKYIGQSYYSHTPKGVKNGRERTINRMKDIDNYFPSLPLHSRVAPVIRNAKVILSGLCSWGTSLGILVKNRAIVSAMQENKTGDKILLTDPVKDDETRGLSWWESTVEFLEAVSGGNRLETLWNKILANSNEGLEQRLIFPPRPQLGTEDRVYRGDFGGYAGANTPTARDLRALKRRGITVSASAQMMRIALQQSRQNPDLYVTLVNAVPELLASEIWKLISPDNQKVLGEPLAFGLIKRREEIEKLLESINLSWESFCMTSIHELIFRPDLIKDFDAWLNRGETPKWLAGKTPQEVWYQFEIRQALQNALGLRISADQIEADKSIPLGFDIGGKPAEIKFLSPEMTDRNPYANGSMENISYKVGGRARLGNIFYGPEFHTVNIEIAYDAVLAGLSPAERIKNLEAIIKFQIEKAKKIAELEGGEVHGARAIVKAHDQILDKLNTSQQPEDQELITRLGEVSIALPLMQHFRRAGDQNKIPVVQNDMDSTTTAPGTPKDVAMAYLGWIHMKKTPGFKEIVTGQSFEGPWKQQIEPYRQTERVLDWVAIRTGVPRTFKTQEIKAEDRVFERLLVGAASGNALFIYDHGQGYKKNSQKSMDPTTLDLIELAAYMTMPEIGYEVEGPQIERREPDHSNGAIQYAAIAILPSGRFDQRRNFDPLPKAWKRRLQLIQMGWILNNPLKALDQLASQVLGPGSEENPVTKWSVNVQVDSTKNTDIPNPPAEHNHNAKRIRQLVENLMRNRDQIKPVSIAGQPGGLTTNDVPSSDKAEGVDRGLEMISAKTPIPRNRLSSAYIGDELSVITMDIPGKGEVEGPGNDYAVADKTPEGVDLLIHTGPTGLGIKTKENTITSFDRRGLMPHSLNRILAYANLSVRASSAVRSVAELHPMAVNATLQKLGLNYRSFGLNGVHHLPEITAREMLQRTQLNFDAPRSEVREMLKVQIGQEEDVDSDHRIYVTQVQRSGQPEVFLVTVTGNRRDGEHVRAGWFKLGDEIPFAEIEGKRVILQAIHDDWVRFQIVSSSPDGGLHLVASQALGNISLFPEDSLVQRAASEMRQTKHSYRVPGSSDEISASVLELLAAARKNLNAYLKQQSYQEFRTELQELKTVWAKGLTYRNVGSIVRKLKLLRDKLSASPRLFRGNPLIESLVQDLTSAFAAAYYSFGYRVGEKPVKSRKIPKPKSRQRVAIRATIPSFEVYPRKQPTRSEVRTLGKTHSLYPEFQAGPGDPRVLWEGQNDGDPEQQSEEPYETALIKALPWATGVIGIGVLAAVSVLFNILIAYKLFLPFFAVGSIALNVYLALQLRKKPVLNVQSSTPADPEKVREMAERQKIEMRELSDFLLVQMNLPAEERVIDSDSMRYIYQKSPDHQTGMQAIRDEIQRRKEIRDREKAEASQKVFSQQTSPETYLAIQDPLEKLKKLYRDFPFVFGQLTAHTFDPNTPWIGNAKDILIDRGFIDGAGNIDLEIYATIKDPTKLDFSNGIFFIPQDLNGTPATRLAHSIEKLAEGAMNPQVSLVERERDLKVAVGLFTLNYELLAPLRSISRIEVLPKKIQQAFVSVFGTREKLLLDGKIGGTTIGWTLSCRWGIIDWRRERPTHVDGNGKKISGKPRREIEALQAANRLEDILGRLTEPMVEYWNASIQVEKTTHPLNQLIVGYVMSAPGWFDENSLQIAGQENIANMNAGYHFDDPNVFHSIPHTLLNKHGIRLLGRTVHDGTAHAMGEMNPLYGTGVRTMVYFGPGSGIAHRVIINGEPFLGGPEISNIQNELPNYLMLIERRADGTTVWSADWDLGNQIAKGKRPPPNIAINSFENQTAGVGKERRLGEIFETKGIKIPDGETAINFALSQHPAIYQEANTQILRELGAGFMWIVGASKEKFGDRYPNILDPNFRIVIGGKITTAEELEIVKKGAKETAQANPKWGLQDADIDRMFVLSTIHDDVREFLAASSIFDSIVALHTQDQADRTAWDAIIKKVVVADGARRGLKAFGIEESDIQKVLPRVLAYGRPLQQMIRTFHRENPLKAIEIAIANVPDKQLGIFWMGTESKLQFRISPLQLLTVGLKAILGENLALEKFLTIDITKLINQRTNLPNFFAQGLEGIPSGRMTLEDFIDHAIEGTAAAELSLQLTKRNLDEPLRALVTDPNLGIAVPDAAREGFLIEELVDLSGAAGAFINAHEYKELIRAGAADHAYGTFLSMRKTKWPLPHLLPQGMDAEGILFKDEFHDYLGIMNHLIFIYPFKHTQYFEILVQELKKAFPAHKVDLALELIDSSDSIRALALRPNSLSLPEIIDDYIRPAHLLVGREILRNQIAEALKISNTKIKIEIGNGSAKLFGPVAQAAFKGNQLTFNFIPAKVTYRKVGMQQPQTISFAEFRPDLQDYEFVHVEGFELAARSEVRSDESLFSIGLSSEDYFKGEFTHDATTDEFLAWIHQKFPGRIIQSAEEGHDVRSEDPPISPTIDLAKRKSFSQGDKVNITFDPRTVKYVALNIALKASKQSLKQASEIFSKGDGAVRVSTNALLSHLGTAEKVNYQADPFIGQLIFFEALQIRERIYENTKPLFEIKGAQEKAQAAFERIQTESKYSEILETIRARREEKDSFDLNVQEVLFPIAHAVNYQDSPDLEIMIRVLSLMVQDSQRKQAKAWLRRANSPIYNANHSESFAYVWAEFALNEFIQRNLPLDQPLETAQSILGPKKIREAEKVEALEVLRQALDFATRSELRGMHFSLSSAFGLLLLVSPALAGPLAIQLGIRATEDPEKKEIRIVTTRGVGSVTLREKPRVNDPSPFWGGKTMQITRPGTTNVMVSSTNAHSFFTATLNPTYLDFFTLFPFGNHYSITNADNVLSATMKQEVHGLRINIAANLTNQPAIASMTVSGIEPVDLSNVQTVIVSMKEEGVEPVAMLPILSEGNPVPMPFSKIGEGQYAIAFPEGATNVTSLTFYFGGNQLSASSVVTSIELVGVALLELTGRSASLQAMPSLNWLTAPALILNRSELRREMYGDRVNIFEDRNAMGEAAARRGVEAAKLLLKISGKRVRIMFAAAPSQMEVVREFVRLALEEGLDFNRIDIFHMDEFGGFNKGQRVSFRNWIFENIEQKLIQGGIKREHIHIHYVPADSRKRAALEKAALEYEKLLNKPMDILFMGYGYNAHVAFNDPPAQFRTKRKVIVVDPAQDPINAKQQMEDYPEFFKKPSDIPLALTVTMPFLKESGLIIATVPAAVKAQANYDTHWDQSRRANPNIPATYFNDLPPERFQMFTDEAGAQLLLRRVNSEIQILSSLLYPAEAFQKRPSYPLIEQLKKEFVMLDFPPDISSYLEKAFQIADKMISERLNAYIKQVNNSAQDQTQIQINQAIARAFKRLRKIFSEAEKKSHEIQSLNDASAAEILRHLTADLALLIRSTESEIQLLQEKHQEKLSAAKTLVTLRQIERSSPNAKPNLIKLSVRQPATLKEVVQAALLLSSQETSLTLIDVAEVQLKGEAKDISNLESIPVSKHQFVTISFHRRSEVRMQKKKSYRIPGSSDELPQNILVALKTAKRNLNKYLSSTNRSTFRRELEEIQTLWNQGLTYQRVGAIVRRIKPLREAVNSSPNLSRSNEFIAPLIAELNSAFVAAYYSLGYRAGSSFGKITGKIPKPKSRLPIPRLEMEVRAHEQRPENARLDRRRSEMRAMKLGQKNGPFRPRQAEVLIRLIDSISGVKESQSKFSREDILHITGINPSVYPTLIATLTGSHNQFLKGKKVDGYVLTERGIEYAKKYRKTPTIIQIIKKDLNGVQHKSFHAYDLNVHYAEHLIAEAVAFGYLERDWNLGEPLIYKWTSKGKELFASVGERSELREVLTVITHQREKLVPEKIRVQDQNLFEAIVRMVTQNSEENLSVVDPSTLAFLEKATPHLKSILDQVVQRQGALEIKADLASENFDPAAWAFILLALNSNPNFKYTHYLKAGVDLETHLEKVHQLGKRLGVNASALKNFSIQLETPRLWMKRAQNPTAILTPDLNRLERLGAQINVARVRASDSSEPGLLLLSTVQLLQGVINQLRIYEARDLVRGSSADALRAELQALQSFLSAA